VNCLDCRRLIEPWLDDALEVSDHVAILEHLDRCPPCRERLAAEERIRDRCRRALAAEACPERVRAGFGLAMRRERRRERVRRGAPLLVLAASLVAAATLRDTPTKPGSALRSGVAPETPTRLRFASRFSAPGRCPAGAHGAFVAWASAEYDALVRGRLADDEALGDDPVSRLCRGGARLSPPEEALADAARALGRPSRVAGAALRGGRVACGDRLAWRDRPVARLLIDFGDREVALYELRCRDVELAALHGAPSRAGVALVACPECDVVAVTFEDGVALLVSRQCRDWDRDWLCDVARSF